MDKKMRNKNQILEYYAPSPVETMRKIQNQLVKNFLI